MATVTHLGQSWKCLDDQEDGSASWLSWGKLSVKIVLYPPPHPKVEGFAALAPRVWGEGSFRADSILYPDLFYVTLLGSWVYSLQDVCKLNLPPPHHAPPGLHSEF